MAAAKYLLVVTLLEEALLPALPLAFVIDSAHCFHDQAVDPFQKPLDFYLHPNEHCYIRAHAGVAALRFVGCNIAALSMSQYYVDTM